MNLLVRVCMHVWEHKVRLLIVMMPLPRNRSAICSAMSLHSQIARCGKQLVLKASFAGLKTGRHRLNKANEL